MPKKSGQVKRVIAKNGQARYFKDGKRITDKKGKLKFVQQNYELLTNPYKDKPQLTAKEQKTLKQVKTQKELYRYQGVPIKRQMTDFLKARGYIDPKSPVRDITKIVSPAGSQLFKNYGQFEQAYYRMIDQFRTTQATSLFGVAGWHGRTENQSAISLFENVSILGRDGWKLKVIDLDGNEFAGIKTGMEKIREYEEMITEDMEGEFENLAAVSFTYILDWDFKTKTITVDLSDAVAQERQSDPKGLSKNKK